MQNFGGGYPCPDSDVDLVKVNNNNNKNILRVLGEEILTKQVSELFGEKTKNILDKCIELRDHCCKVFSVCMGMNIVNMRVDLSNHYTKEYSDVTKRWEYSQFIVHFRERRDDPDDPLEKVIIQDFEYRFSPRSRRGKVLRHCYYILRMIAEINECGKHITQLRDDEEEWERDLLLGEI